MKKITFCFSISVLLLSLNAQKLPTGINIGDKAPDFKAKNQTNKTIELKEVLNTGSVVLFFYRGEWCPYCNKQLKSMQDSLHLITQKGANVIAVSPEKQENIKKTIDKTKATFNIVNDENATILNSYKVKWDLDEKTTKKYKGYGIDLLEMNGSNGNSLPVPAVYIISQDGIITYKYFNQDYTKRPSVAEILKHL
jgi:peroxiredoxin